MTLPETLAMPFQLTNDGKIASETNPDKELMDRVRALIGTLPGERVMLIDYGVPLSSFLFEPDSFITENEVTRLVESALGTWETGALGSRITPITGDQGTGLIDVQIQLPRTTVESSPAYNSRIVNYATVKVGGTVRESSVG